MKIEPIVNNAIEITTSQGIVYSINDGEELGLQIKRQDRQEIKVSTLKHLENKSLGNHHWVVLDRKG